MSQTNAMVLKALVMELLNRGYMDRRLKAHHHAANVGCGFWISSEECLLVSGQIVLQYRTLHTQNVPCGGLFYSGPCSGR